MNDAGKEDNDEPATPQVIQKVDQKQLQHFVQSIKTAEQQIGENIVRALSHDDTVAVLTTVVMGPKGQQIVSASLDPKLMQQVQQLLMGAQKERVDEEPCMGFHCFIKLQKATDDNSVGADESKPDSKPEEA